MQKKKSFYKELKKNRVNKSHHDLKPEKKIRIQKKKFMGFALKTLLDTGSQLAHDRFVTGSVAGRRSLFYYGPTTGPFSS